MTDLRNRKPILCLDFDGVCHSYTSGWKGAAVIPDPPVPGLWEFLAKALYVFEVHIFSSRTHQEGGVEAMRAWFAENCPEWATWTLKELQVPTEKPPAFEAGRIRLAR
jgi:hypothetical protein